MMWRNGIHLCHAMMIMTIVAMPMMISARESISHNQKRCNEDVENRNIVILLHVSDETS